MPRRKNSAKILNAKQNNAEICEFSVKTQKKTRTRSLITTLTELTRSFFLYFEVVHTSEYNYYSEYTSKYIIIVVQYGVLFIMWDKAPSWHAHHMICIDTDRMQKDLPGEK